MTPKGGKTFVTILSMLLARVSQRMTAEVYEYLP